jgi:outer membrane protein OmpA-like peptidoglycan-associated protein
MKRFCFSILAGSFGKEKPRVLCHEQTCWAKNRRADFVDEWK